MPKAAIDQSMQARSCCVKDVIIGSDADAIDCRSVKFRNPQRDKDHADIDRGNGVK